MEAYRSPHAGTPRVREYDRKRKLHMADAIWEALLITSTVDGQCYLGTSEVMDAMALVGGMLLADHPDAKVPSKRREMCAEWGRSVDKSIVLALATDGSLSQAVSVVVLSEPGEARQ